MPQLTSAETDLRAACSPTSVRSMPRAYSQSFSPVLGPRVPDSFSLENDRMSLTNLMPTSSSLPLMLLCTSQCHLCLEDISTDSNRDVAICFCLDLLAQVESESVRKFLLPPYAALIDSPAIRANAIIHRGTDI
ncbi:hypothetical protein HYQ46_005928 [Verticillium longisporum]|nr:hypothetical protein HYQ46_005928 [Verticillium longisporum]